MGFVYTNRAVVWDEAVSYRLAVGELPRTMSEKSGDRLPHVRVASFQETPGTVCRRPEKKEEKTWPTRKFASSSRPMSTASSTSPQSASSRRRRERAPGCPAHSAAYRKGDRHHPARSPQVQGLSRAVRAPHPQAADRHPAADPQDGGRADQDRSAGGRGNRNQAVIRA